ncbi:homoserine O-succinyltransferase [Streptococcus sp. DD13]|uniref:homoserine O-succinyltransferase n=1 Tax=Streptococcus sp. DD13 TaxID=1777881 RepID=UPI00079CA674|nr:homoserine O-succinyltransferase [Streptococcus sp. DD13]KXT79131.1 Homoserine O-succinyltransferase [Streptococcus sp. DD13]
MPIMIDNSLPAVEVLRKENIFVMDNNRAVHQDIRPLNVLILNLMPTKEVTETQLLRLLSNTPLQINVDLLHMVSHKSKNTKEKHLHSFYKTFEEVQDMFYDGFIVTGAPVETLPFEKVDYWEEISQVFRWAKKHVFSTLHLCWGAQAGLYHKYGIEKYHLGEKLSGIYLQTVVDPTSPLMRGFDDQFFAPHSRYTGNDLAEIRSKSCLQVLASGEEVGVSILASRDLREIYSFGHLEYDRDTLAREYERDIRAGKNPRQPWSYFPENNEQERPVLKWNLAAATFFSNWINYAVYQETPYDWSTFEDSAASASL